MVYLKKIINCIALCLFFSLSVFNYAQASSLKIDTVIRDDEIDSILMDWMQKLFKVAKIPNTRPDITILYNPELNAYATLGGQIYILTGFLDRCEHVGQFLGVMAHEVGHIAGGHVIMRDAQASQARLGGAVPLILGAVGLLAGGGVDVGLAGVMGGAHVYNQVLLQNSRIHETSADQSAYRYLKELNWPSKGMYEFFEILHKKENPLSERAGDVYSRTHPLTNDRLQYAKLRIEQDQAPDFPAKMHQDFNRIKAKLWAFTVSNPKSAVNQKNKLNQFDDFSKEYALCILYFRQGNLPKAIESADKLLNLTPDDPYLLELKGQFYFEHGKVKDSIPYLQKAVQLKPRAPFMRLMLAQALLDSKNNDSVKQAITHLCVVTEIEPNLVFTWRLQAKAYGLNNQPALAKWALAEEAFLLGQFARANKLISDLMKDKNFPQSKETKLLILRDQVRQEMDKEKLKRTR